MNQAAFLHTSLSADILRIMVFVGAFVLLAVLEFVRPRRQRTQQKAPRWFSNIALTLSNTLLLKLLLPISAVAFASYTQDQQWGLFQLSMLAWLPHVVVVVIAVILLDGAIYWQHRIFHRVPWLWRMHAVHHSDKDLDVSSALRFHPLEILLSMAIKFAVIAVLGAPALSVLIFEVLLNAMAMFNHSNLRLPATWEQPLRRIIVTPDMHRIHHSERIHECNSNYGFNLSIWDRLFNSYTHTPKSAHTHMPLGLGGQHPPSKHLPQLWQLPFALKPKQSPNKRT